MKNKSIKSVFVIIALSILVLVAATSMQMLISVVRAAGDALPARINQSTGTTWYVDDVTGSDSNSSAEAQSENTPWKTVQKAIDTIDFANVTGGAIVAIKAHGSAGYQKTGASAVDATLNFSSLGARSPTASNVATFKGYGSTRPVIIASTGSTETEHNCARMQGANAKYIRLQQLELVGDGTTHGGDAPAIAIDGGANHIEIYDVWVHDILAVDKAQGIYLGDDSGGSDNVHCWYSKFYNIGNNPGADTSLEHGAYIQGTNHWFVGCAFYNNRNGFGAQMFGDTAHSAPGHRMTHCTFYFNKKSGLILDGSAYTGIIVANSISYDNDENGFTTRSSASGTFRNCIANANQTNFLQQASSTLTQVDCLTDDPTFVDAAGFNFHLQSSSPARGASDVDYSPSLDLDLKSRTTFDVGAFEYITGRSPVSRSDVATPRSTASGRSAASNRASIP